jgi:Zn-dependent peptidase ImmA (M78 family)
MPRQLFSEIVGHGIDLNDEARLSEIARRFKVSLAALQYRLASID